MGTNEDPLHYAVSFFLLFRNISEFHSRSSSVSKWPDYRLEDRRSTPGRGNDRTPSLCHRCVRTNSGAHPDSYVMGIGGSFPEGKLGVAGHLPPSSAEGKNT